VCRPFLLTCEGQQCPLARSCAIHNWCRARMKAVNIPLQALCPFSLSGSPPRASMARIRHWNGGVMVSDIKLRPSFWPWRRLPVSSEFSELLTPLVLCFVSLPPFVAFAFDSRLPRAPYRRCFFISTFPLPVVFKRRVVPTGVHRRYGSCSQRTKTQNL